MKYRKLGETDLELSVVTFGAWAIGGWMWGGADRKDAIDAIRTAYDQGVTSIDTAPVYGQGTSEEIVGEALKDIGRDKVQILTKYGMRWDLKKGDYAFPSKDEKGRDLEIYKYAGREGIRKEIEDSLRRLSTDYIDLYQIHWPDSTTPIQESMETVAELIKEGKVRYAGVCNYGLEDLQEAEKYIDLASDQVPYSMVNRDIEDEVIPWCIKNNRSVIAYSPLQRGLLTGKFKPGHQFNEGDHRADQHYFKDENLKRTNEFLDRIKPMADEKGLTLAQLVILWTVEQAGITIALVGARNASQAVQNARAMNSQLSDEEIEIINRELDKLILVE